MVGKKGMSRRQFLAAGAGVTVAVLGGGGYLATRGPEIDFYETVPVFGNASSNGHKVLVAYASRYGTTGEVAGEIATTLINSGLDAEVKLIENITDLTQYDSVIVGSPVRIGKWLPEATEFVEQHKKQLSQLKVAYFLTSMTLGTSQQLDERDEVKEILDDVQQQVPEVIPVSKGYFAGALDYGKMSPAMRTAFKLMANAADKDASEGDYRDWEAIGRWAREVGQIIS